MNDEERGTTGQDDVAKAKAEVKVEIDEVKAKSEAEKADAERILAQKLLSDLRDKAIAAKEVTDMHKAVGHIELKKKEAVSVKVALVKVLEGVKAGIIKPLPKTKVILDQLAERSGSFTDTTASYLQPLLEKYIEKDITFSKEGQELTKFVQDFRQLKKDNSIAAELLGQILYNNASELGITKEDLQRQLELNINEEGKVTIPKEKVAKRENEDETFDYDWRQMFNQFYTNEDKEILKALYSADNFKEYLLKTRREIESLHQGEDLSGDELMFEISEKIETDIVLTYSKLFTRVDRQKPGQFFEEIIQQGFMDSIQLAQERFKKRLELLTTSMEVLGEDETLKNFKFTKRYSREEIYTKKRTYENGEEKLIPQYKVFPLSRLQTGVSLKEYLESVYVELDHEFETRAFLHNIRALFLKGPQKEGFWPTIASYAEKMVSTDIDSIMNLPDSELFMTAYRLYQKYVEETFASNDWIHFPNMFSTDMANIYSKIEQKVIEALKNIYPENTEKVSTKEWRLRRAMTMAVGLARGILLTEPETAAWADPHIKHETGGATFWSYYTNDNIALNGLNPLHTFLRFFTETNDNGPLLFMLTSGFEPKLLEGWNHRELWDKMNNFFKTFSDGQGILHPKNPDERTIFEILPNIMNVGSVITRDGWRTDAALDAWIQYKGAKEKTVTGNIDIVKTWQTIEGIGYEALFTFVNNQVSTNADFLQGKKPYSEQERDEFLRDLYIKYINPDSGGMQALLDRYEKDAEKAVDKVIKQGKKSKKDRKDLIIQETYRKFIYRALVGVLANRIPTKFIRIERDRLSKTGTRAWEKIRQAAGPGWDHEKLDLVMRDLLIVETQLRQDVSRGMRDYIGRQERENIGRAGTLFGFDISSYVVTPELIGKYIKDATRKENAVTLYNLIRQNYLNNEDFLSQFTEDIRLKDAANMLLPSKKFPFAIATEELDTTFLAFRNSGERTLARAAGDIGSAETIAFAEIQKIMQSLRPISLDGKHDFGSLIESIEKVKIDIESRINKELAHKVASHMASIVISYFKKDTVARNLFTKFFVMGQKHSLAAEFAGQFSNVWEWDVGEIDKFVFELGRRRIIPREPYDLSKGPIYEEKEVENNFLGKLLGKKTKKIRVKRAPDYEYYEGKFRKDFGATWTHKIWEMANTILPLLALFILWKWISEAFKETEGKQK